MTLQVLLRFLLGVALALCTKHEAYCEECSQWDRSLLSCRGSTSSVSSHMLCVRPGCCAKGHRPGGTQKPQKLVLVALEAAIPAATAGRLSRLQTLPIRRCLLGTARAQASFTRVPPTGHHSLLAALPLVLSRSRLGFQHGVHGGPST